MFDSCRRGALTAEVRRREDEPATPTTFSPNISGGPGLLQAGMMPCDVGLKLKPPHPLSDSQADETPTIR